MNMNQEFTFTLNGENVRVNTLPETPLLYVLRNSFQLNGPKFGCGEGQCMSCAVLIDGKAMPSCKVTVSSVTGREITTLEGLVSKNGNLHKVQQAFIDEQAAQCGYCLNGMVMGTVSLLNEIPDPSEEEIRSRLSAHICRCGVHSRIIKAVKKAANL